MICCFLDFSVPLRQKTLPIIHDLNYPQVGFVGFKVFKKKLWYKIIFRFGFPKIGEIFSNFFEKKVRTLWTLVTLMQ
jgi:hypothetical protein